MSEIIIKYNNEVNPSYVEYRDEKTKRKKKEWSGTRAEKDTRYGHFNEYKTATLAQKERWSIDLIKLGISRSEKPYVACSFGIDSMVSIYLTRKALVELGRDPSDIDITWVDTLNEFLSVRNYARIMKDEWNLRLIVGKPKRTLKQVIDGNGGVTSDYFFAGKGSRKNGQPLGEKCCNTLKHKPMELLIKENKWDCQINGLRADESKTRLKAGLRDGEFFYSRAMWKMYMVRPILWWVEEDLWNYVEQENIPFNDLYENNLIQKYPVKLNDVVSNNEQKLVEYGIDVNSLLEQQVQTVSRKQAILLEKLGFKLFTPRTGCQMCPIPVKYGYLQWMRIYYPKVFDAMVYKLGYGKVLIDMIPQDVKDELKDMFGIDVAMENIHEHLQAVLLHKPCVFDKF